MNTQALKDLLYKMADDLLILGHRNSEWTGLGPILEEDIAFSSMAQDKLGHAQSLYQLLHALGEQEPDALAFNREASRFHNAQFTELPNGDYSFSVMRHFLFDYADQLRFQMLAGSSYEPLAKLALKIKGELKYHTFHAHTWVTRLGAANEESHLKMQAALNEAWNYALGIFEPGAFESDLAAAGIFPGEAELQWVWFESVAEVLESVDLKIPAQQDCAPVYGGRTGNHTAYLESLVSEMGEVFRIDPSAEW